MAFTEKTQKTIAASSYSLFLHPQFFAVVFSHFLTDMYVSQRSIYLAYLAGPLGMNNATLGLITTIAVMAAGLSQPLFGWVSDRIGARSMILIALVWITITFAISVVAPMAAAPALLVLANLGAGMYHPAGVAQATRIGKQEFAGRETTAASYFFVFGQTGFFVGPLLGGLLLGRWGENSLLVLLALAIPGIIFASTALKSLPSAAQMTAETPTGEKQKTPVFAAIALIATTAFHAWANQNVSAFVPKHLADLGYSPSTYGFLASIFTMGGAVGTFFGGALADRFGKRRIIGLCMGGASLPLLLLGYIPYSFWWYVLLFIAGGLTGAAYSSLVVLGQRLAPGSSALASGLVLGFVFSAGAAGAALTGVIADAHGFAPVYLLSAGLALAGGLLGQFVDDRRVTATR
jgi:FSR family fosmidomycin resistance protein-like MFS transporter